jgi:hypothetical protein
MDSKSLDYKRQSRRHTCHLISGAKNVGVGMADSKGKCLTPPDSPLLDEIVYEFPEHRIIPEYFYFD